MFITNSFLRTNQAPAKSLTTGNNCGLELRYRILATLATNGSWEWADFLLHRKTRAIPCIDPESAAIISACRQTAPIWSPYTAPASNRPLGTEPERLVATD